MRYLLLFLLLAGCQQPQKTATEEAVEFVRSEASHLSKAPEGLEYRFYAALSAMNYIQTNVSSTRYGYLVEKTGQIPQGGTEYCLLENRGACGNQVEAFIDILKALNVPARPVQVYYEKDGSRYSHALAEVEWAGSWHMFDITWGFVPHNGNPLEALSYNEARKRGTTEGLHNQASLLRVYSSNDDSIFKYLTSGDVVTDGTGTINLPLVGDKFSFAHLPTYIGRVGVQSGNIGSISIHVDPEESRSITITPSGLSCLNGEIATNSQSVKITQSPMTINVSGPTTLSVKSDEDICYVVIKEITLDRHHVNHVAAAGHAV